MSRLPFLLFRASIVLASALTTVSAATFTVSNTNSSGKDSLFQAITDANAQPGEDTVEFNIPTAGPWTIATTYLPNITDPVTIDATTQPDFRGKPVVELVGSGSGSSGFLCIAGGNTIRGFAINGYGTAIYLYGGSSSNRIEGCWLGLDSNGQLAGTNSQGVIIESGRDNVIGGTSPEARNVIVDGVRSRVSRSDLDATAFVT